MNIAITEKPDQLNQSLPSDQRMATFEANDPLAHLQLAHNVMTTTSSIHADLAPGSLQTVSEGFGGKLASLVRVEDLRWAIAIQRLI